MLDQFIAPLYRLLIVAFFSGLLSAFWISVASISGFREYLAVRSNRFFHKLVSCDFCLSFWVSVIFSLAGYYFIPDPGWLLAPFLSTPISKLLLS